MGSERGWFVQVKGTAQGPFTSAQLKQFAAKAKVTPETSVRLGEDGTWVPAAKVKGLFSPQRSLAEVGAASGGLPTATERPLAARQQLVDRPARPTVLVPENTQIRQVTTISTPPASIAQTDRVPCRFCGEEIAASAIKCRFCNEFLDGRPREHVQAAPQQVVNASPVIAPNVNVIVNQQTNVGGVRKRWSRLLAMLLSFLIPGLGQLYKGQPINGLVWFIVVVIGYVCLVIPGVVLHVCCILGAGMGDPYR